MSLEAIKSISAAEELARQRKLEAEQNAKKALDETDKAGRADIDAAKARAETEIKQLMRAAEAKATENALALNQKTANKQAAMRAHAESRMDQAAQRIVERIVNS